MSQCLHGQDPNHCYDCAAPPKQLTDLLSEAFSARYNQATLAETELLTPNGFERPRPVGEVPPAEPAPPARVVARSAYPTAQDRLIAYERGLFRWYVFFLVGGFIACLAPLALALLGLVLR